jgi:hypothetical protein
MRFYVGVTDNVWLDFLQQFGSDEVNFRRLGGKEFSDRDRKCAHTFTSHVPSSGAAAIFLPPGEAPK